VRFVSRVLAAAAALSLSACAGLSSLSSEGGVEFELTARIAVRFGEEATSGNLAWRHLADGDELLITNPFGQGVARVVRDRTLVILTTQDAREYRAEDAETLTDRVLGFRLPLAGLADWVRARAAPGPSRATRDARGRLTELLQSGWKIEYLAFRDDGELPSRMRLSYPGLELRLAISDWRTVR